MPPPTKSTYKHLVTKITKEIADVENFIQRRTAEGYWKIGRYIDQHLLENKDRAGYGTVLLENLAKDVGRDRTTLQRSLQFYRAYPIRAIPHKLTWEHYRNLITVKDPDERKKIEEKVIRGDWNSTKLRDYLNTKRELSSDDEKPIPQLKFTRGQLHTYTLIKANQTFDASNLLALDLGFRLQYAVPENNLKLNENDSVELTFADDKAVSVKKVDVVKDSLFTYQAFVDKVVDGDTLIVTFDFKLPVSIGQKLRLRGIDCPEMDTDEGKKAKRFVEARLKNCDFIIVKTFKDRSDKFDRYLADVFYLSGEKDPAVVVAQGTYLNQELLNERLARLWT